MAVSVDFCRRDDLPRLFELFADWYAFNPRMREADYFDWQFRNTPISIGDGEYNFLVLREDGDIGGCLGYCPFVFVHGGRRMIGAWTHNWQVREGASGGLKLLSRFMEMFDHRFFLRINNLSGGVFNLLKVPILDRMPRVFLLPDVAVAAQCFKFSAADRRTAEAFARRLQGLPSPCVEEVSHFPVGEEFDLSHWKGTEGWVCREATYLNWRFRDIPRHSYRFLRSDTGAGVFRIETIMGTEINVVRILDWTFRKEETGCALAGLLRAVEKDRPILFDFCCTHSGVRNAMSRYGFLEEEMFETAPPDLFRPMNRSRGCRIAIDLPPHRTSRNFPFDRWFITTGESDIDRVKL